MLLLIGPLGANVNEVLNKIQNFSLMEMDMKISSVKLWSFCPGGDEFNLLYIEVVLPHLTPKHHSYAIISKAGIQVFMTIILLCPLATGP